MDELLKSGFQDNLLKLINDSVGEKMNSIKTRDEELIEREKRVEHILSTYPPSQVIKLNISGKIFITTSDILTSVKDCYFCGLLSKNFKQEEEIFIPRSPKVFKYVMEYLIYREISQINDPILLNHLIKDAEYFLLEELKEMATTMLGNLNLTSQSRKFVSLSSSANPGNGQYYIFNIVNAISSNDDFTVNGNRVTIRHNGTYQLSVKEPTQNSSNGSYFSINKNGANLSSCYRSDNTGYQDTRSITEVWTLQQNDYLQIYTTYNTPPNNIGVATFQFSIVSLN